MSLKTFTIDFREFSQGSLIRSNYKTAILGIEIKKHIQESEKSFVRLKEYFDIVSGFAFKSGDYEQDGIPLIRIGDVENDFNENNMAFLPEEYKEDYSKFLLKKNDILVSLTGDGKLKTDLVEENDKYLLNQRVGSLRAKNEINVLFYFYLLNYFSFTKKQFYWWSNGKTQLNISPFDFLQIKIPLIPKSKQDQIVAQIEPIEKKIKELKSKLVLAREIINKVFAQESGFDENLFNEFGKGMTAGTQIAQNRTLRTFETYFSNLARSSILRFSTRFHNAPTKKLMDFLDSIETLQVKDIVESYEKGIQPKYNTDGEIPVVKIANLKNSYIDFAEAEKISQSDFDKLKDEKKLKPNDIIICATGKISLGKIDFYDYEDEATTSVDNYIIRLNGKCNPLFFTYFFRSILGYFQVERDFTGTTNQIHLYWNQISNFKFPNISLKNQQKIVDEIKTELDKQEEMNQTIETERNKIGEIIEKAM